MSDAPCIEIERETITNLATGNVTIKKTELKAVCASCKWHCVIDGYMGGICRRHSPAVCKDGFKVFPFVEDTDWCGDWERKQ